MVSVLSRWMFFYCLSSSTIILTNDNAHIRSSKLVILMRYGARLHSRGAFADALRFINSTSLFALRTRSRSASRLSFRLALDDITLTFFILEIALILVGLVVCALSLVEERRSLDLLQECRPSSTSEPQRDRRIPPPRYVACLIISSVTIPSPPQVLFAQSPDKFFELEDP